MTTKKKTERERAVLVTTAYRGVFFGYTTAADSAEQLVLTRARNVVSWTSTCRGVFGLAASGPLSGCRIGPEVPRIDVRGVTSITDCTPVAVEAFGKGPWA